MKSQIKGVLAKFGIRNSYDARHYRRYKELNKRLEQTNPIQTAGGVLIIFSKDRAMQLDALLRSYFHYVNNPQGIKVLYYASDEKFNRGYEELKENYKDADVQFIKEEGFRKDLISIFNKLEVAKVFFLVDDLFFKSTLDLDEFIKVDPKQYVVSLRMGKHLKHSYTLNKSQKLPAFKKVDFNSEMISWSYQDAELDWDYPLSVDGHLFDFEEMKVMVNQLEYKAPNSFEEALQIMNPLFKKRTGLCYSKSKIINNPCNKVQLENDNFSGDLTIEELNQKWLEGYRIHFEKHEEILNRSAHQELTFEFVKR